MKNETKNEKLKAGKEMLYSVFRVFVGLLFMTHGAQKFGLIGTGSVSAFAGFFSLPLPLAYAAAITELIGGAMIALGLFSGIAAALGSVVAITALAMAHFPKSPWPWANGGELAMMFLFSFMAIIANGSGKYSLDRLIKRKTGG